MEYNKDPRRGPINIPIPVKVCKIPITLDISSGNLEATIANASMSD
jgi:hypothetical protein